MSDAYDVIVVGARCGGSPTAMLLARAGHRVLLIDRATFPSDTMSTHVIHPPGVAALARWGLLGALEASACPPISRYSFDFGPVTVSGTPRAADGAACAYAPRRTVLDALVVDAAVAAGAELREGFTVDDILVDDGRVAGVRGHQGAVGRSPSARRRRRGRTALPCSRRPCAPSGIRGATADAGLLRVLERSRRRRVRDLRPRRGWPRLGGGAHPRRPRRRRQGWPQSQFEANRKDVEGTYMKSFELVPDFAERIGAATRETRFVGSGDLPGFFRTPFGPGWALVGDAGYHKHPITAFGISDAFRDARRRSPRRSTMR